MSTPTPAPSSSPDTNQAAATAAAQRDAAAQRFAEVALKSRPIPEGVDPNARATLSEAVKTIKAEDVLKIHQAPCTREGLLTGIGSGATIGALRYIVGGEQASFFLFFASTLHLVKKDGQENSRSG